MIYKLQSLKGKAKLNFLKNLNNFFDETNIRNFKFEEDPFSKKAQVLAKFIMKYCC